MLGIAGISCSIATSSNLSGFVLIKMSLLLAMPKLRCVGWATSVLMTQPSELGAFIHRPRLPNTVMMPWHGEQWKRFALCRIRCWLVTMMLWRCGKRRQRYQGRAGRVLVLAELLTHLMKQEGLSILGFGVAMVMEVRHMDGGSAGAA